MKKYLLILFSLYAINSFCQDTIITKLIVFDQDDVSDFTSEKGEINKNAIKINPLLLVTGEIPIYYERAFSNSFSLEAAIGLTFKNYLGDLFDENNNSFEVNDKKEQVHSNPSFKLGVRYYTDGIDLEGVYFAFEFAARKYSITKAVTYSSSTANYSRTTINLKEETSMKEYKLILGFQNFGYSDNFLVDYYIGIGLRNQNITEIGEQQNNNISVPVLDTYSKFGPAFYVGLKIGFDL